MNTFLILGKGAVKSATAYRLILVSWLIMLLLICLVALPLKAHFSSFFTNSMIGDSFSTGFDLEVLGDINQLFPPFISHAFRSIILLLLSGIVLYSFFAGGLFANFAASYSTLSVPDFMKASAHYFLSFLAVGTITVMLVISWAVLSIAVPLSLVGSTASGAGLKTTVMITGGVFLLGLPVWLLVADNARVWITVTGSRKVFSAVGAGFRNAFLSFSLSYFSVLIILIVNILFILLIFRFLTGMMPEGAFAILMFFVATQLAAILKVWVRAWRYATVAEIASRERP